MKSFILSAFLCLCFVGKCRAEEQPPYETKDPAITENFRQIYYQVDNLISNPTSLLTYAVFPGSDSISTSYFNIIGATVTIVPKNLASKIRIHVSLGNFGTLTNAERCIISVKRGSTDLPTNAGLSGGFGMYQSNAGAGVVTFSGELIDLPLTTSATSYQLVGKSVGGATCYFGDFISTINTIYAEDLGQ